MTKLICFIACIALISIDGTAKTFSSSKTPDSSRAVVLALGGFVVPFDYTKLPIQWLGFLHASYGITRVVSVEGETAIGSPNYDYLSGSSFLDSLAARKNENFYYVGAAVRFKIFKLNKNVNVSVFAGMHYAFQNAIGIDAGARIESRTGRLGLMIEFATAFQLQQIENKTPIQIIVGADYSILKDLAVTLQGNLGFLGARAYIGIGLMAAL